MAEYKITAVSKEIIVKTHQYTIEADSYQEARDLVIRDPDGLPHTESNRALMTDFVEVAGIRMREDGKKTN